MPFEEIWSYNAAPAKCPNAGVPSKSAVEGSSRFNEICFSVRGKSAEAAVKALEHFGQITIETPAAPEVGTISGAQTEHAQPRPDDASGAVSSWMPILSLPIAVRADLIAIVRAIDSAFEKMTAPDAGTRDEGGKEFAKLLYETKESYLICLAKIREKPLYQRTPEQQKYIKEALNFGSVASLGIGGQSALEELMWLASHLQELKQKLKALNIIDSVPSQVRSAIHGARVSADRDLSREHARGYHLIKTLHDQLKELNSAGMRGLPALIIQTIAHVLLEQGLHSSGRERDIEVFQSVVRDYFPKLISSKHCLRALFEVSTRLSRNPFENLACELRRSDKTDGIKRLCDKLKLAAAASNSEYLDRNKLKISARTMMRWARDLEDRFLEKAGSEFQFNDF